jgi:CCR4-NOT transcription complex subunit 3
MTDKRKLQAEIDRTLKKVQEGIDKFQEILEKFNQTSNNQTTRDKCEAELKQEIKRLQRLRDQIKGWIAGNEVKDKCKLEDARKLIESKMELFKSVERETKTKAYSKEGLTINKQDPEVVRKKRSMDWVQRQIKILNEENEKREAEIESLQSAGKKKKADPDKKNKTEKLRQVINKHMEQIKHLEEHLLKLITKLVYFQEFKLLESTQKLCLLNGNFK